MAYADLILEVREALGVSSSYDAVTIPAALKSSAIYLLKGYNFPRNMLISTTSAVPAGTGALALPSMIKKEELLLLRDARTAGQPAYKQLQKSEGFRMPAQDDMPNFYWLAGNSLIFDTVTPEAGLDLVLYYQSLDPVSAEAWLTVDFREELINRTVYSKAAALRKPEVMQAYTPLWRESQTALAKYLNELEFDGLVMTMRQSSEQRGERYPR
jgi:hypothetical protein